MVSFFGEVKMFRFWPKTMGYKSITHGLISGSPKKVLRKLYHRKGNEKRNLMALFQSHGTFR